MVYGNCCNMESNVTSCVHGFIPSSCTGSLVILTENFMLNVPFEGQIEKVIYLHSILNLQVSRPLLDQLSYRLEISILVTLRTFPDSIRTARENSNHCLVKEKS